MDRHAIIDKFTRDLRYCAENGLPLELPPVETRQLALAMEDYDFDDNRRIDMQNVEHIIKDAVNSAVFNLDDEVADECISRIFRGASEVHT